MKSQLQTSLDIFRVAKVSLRTDDITYVSKGWGYEKWVVNKQEYCGKLLFFFKGKKCSWHYHKVKDETFYIQSGKIKLLWSNDSTDKSKANQTILSKGDVWHVKIGQYHQMIALEDTELFEFSTEHFDEDSYRIEKGD
jgi:quercetin dioxygenase-like cupin family protein